MPQASAHVTTSVQHMLEHIYSFVDGIEAKTNNLPADPASNTLVNTRASQTSVNTLQTTANGIDTKVTNIENIVGGLGAGGNGSPTCVTMDINRDGQIDRFEISPDPHLRVNYAGCDLSFLNLNLAFLMEANLSNANLRNTNLIDASLIGANLQNTNLFGANLGGADLTGADFTGCIGDPVGVPSAGTLPDCA